MKTGATVCIISSDAASFTAEQARNGHAVMGNNRLMTSQHSECECYRARRWLAAWPAITNYFSLFRYSQSSLGYLHNGHCSRRRADNE